jgi:hypothetical protein
VVQNAGNQVVHNGGNSTLGLPPIAESLFKFSHGRPPKDPEKKAKALQNWLLKVGWRI